MAWVRTKDARDEDSEKRNWKARSARSHGFFLFFWFSNGFVKCGPAPSWYLLVFLICLCGHSFSNSSSSPGGCAGLLAAPSWGLPWWMCRQPKKPKATTAPVIETFQNHWKTKKTEKIHGLGENQGCEGWGQRKTQLKGSFFPKPWIFSFFLVFQWFCDMWPSSVLISLGFFSFPMFLHWVELVPSGWSLSVECRVRKTEYTYVHIYAHAHS